MRVADLEAIRIKLASPEDILSWSHGEVTKPETINYRTQKSEKDGLFCQKIFGPEKDFECYCGKYKRVRYKGVVCDRCGVEVTKASVRRERMGHIKLACPVSHIWFLRGVPSRMGLVLDIPAPQLEKVIYFAAYIVTKVDEEARKKKLEEIEKEYGVKVKRYTVSQPVSSNVKRKTTNDTGSDTDKRKTIPSELKEARDRARTELLSIQPLKILSEIEYHNLSLKYGEVFEAGTGAETLRKIFEKVSLKKSIAEIKKKIEKSGHATGEERRKDLRRLRNLEAMLKAGIRPEWMFLTVLPVLPPDLRPMVQLDGGRFASSDLNDLYRRVINRNNRLKYLLEINAPDVIVRNEKRMLQEAVDALIDNGMRKAQTTQATTGGRRLLKSLADMLAGKQGRFRQNLLGKRVDYSGRSVIVVGPDLKFNQCGIPKTMALELFKPFVIRKILEKGLAFNVRQANRLIEQQTAEVWALLEEVVKGKLVLLNRAPTLHRLGIQAFEPVLIEGEAIQLHPLACKAFNADFDGDQMAVHIPLSEEAQKEAKERMLPVFNLLKPATGLPIVEPTKDIVLGCYWITRLEEKAKGEGKVFGSKNEAILAKDTEVVDLRAKIKVVMKGKFVETSVGRILFNNCLPNGYPFVNEVVRAKKLEKIVGDIIAGYDSETVGETLDKIKKLGFEYSSISGITWGMDDLLIPKEKHDLIQEAEKKIEMIETHFGKGLLSREEKADQTIEIWQRTKGEIEKLVPKTLPSLGSVFSIIDSGAGGSWSQPIQMGGMKGLVINPAGKIIELPIKSSYKEGFDVLEFFIATHGARKGTTDTALRTSTAGYLTRRLVDVSHEVVVTEEDCGDKEGVFIFRKDAEDIGQDFSYKLVGRVALEKIQDPKSKIQIVKAGEVIDWKKAKALADSGIEKVRVRSPLSCKTKRGICRKCYGWDLGRNQMIKLGEAVGIVAAQAIGEPGTQLTMRTFHTGGVASGGDITQGLPRVEEIFETRTPAAKAVISRVEGKVVGIEKGIIKIKSKAQMSNVKSNPKSKIQKQKSKKAKEEEIVEHKVAAKMGVLVKEGDEVKIGQPLCRGVLDLKDIFRVLGPDEVQRYIIKEIQNIYVSQGATIHDKHLEIIVRQMFSRVKIKEGGDGPFSAGEIVEKGRVLEENAALKKQKKQPIVYSPILLGISKVALTTDSFLSAASFQETSRVLIKASIEGKEDKLRGLKENVIIGKLIPAGTGFRK